MGFWEDFTGESARKDAEAGYDDSTGMLKGGLKKAEGSINTGYRDAQGYLGQGQNALRNTYQTAYQGFARDQRNTGAALQPYLQSGGRANTMYGNALGLNGIDAQRQFGDHYASSDPFRQQNSDMASDSLMRQMNARGMSGSGRAAEAVARQSLMRGSEDYNNYLNRLAGMQSQGQNAATTMAGLRADDARFRAGLTTDYGRGMAGINTQQAGLASGRGSELANLYYGDAQQRAGLRTGLANAQADSRSTTWNNLMGLGSTLISGFNASRQPGKTGA